MLTLVISQAFLVNLVNISTLSRIEGAISVFYDLYIQLCVQKGVSPSRAAEENGLSRTAVVKWKNGSTPSGATVQKLAAYFGVTADYLMGGTVPGDPVSTAQSPDDITCDDFTYALLNESRQLTDRDKQMLLEMARYMRKKLSEEQP